MRATLRSALLAPVVGGTLLVLVPTLLASPGLSVASAPQGLLGALLVVAGLVVVVWTIREFAVVGHGTPVPIDPPRRLVTSGPYRYVRNPMALGFMTTIVGEAALLGSPALLVYAVLALGALHLLVTGYEEPTTRRRFGSEYDAYCGAVGRWGGGSQALDAGHHVNLNDVSSSRASASGDHLARSDHARPTQVLRVPSTSSPP